jgi:hypothetical protein
MLSARDILLGITTFTLAFGPGRAQASPPVTAPAGSTAALRTPAPASPRPIGGFVEAPAHRGTGYFVVAGLLTGASVIQQTAAYLLLQHTCGVARAKLDPLQTFDGEQTSIRHRSELAAGAALFGLACLGSAGPALTLRMQTPLYLGAAVGLASAGGLARGRTAAFRDALVRPRDRGRARLPVVLGGVLVGTGVAMWLGTRIALLDNKPGCASLRCILAYDLLTLNSSAWMTISGAALLSHGIAYRRHIGRYIRIRELGATPFASRGSYGLAISGAF